MNPDVVAITWVTGVVIIPFTLAILNRYYKWMTKKEFENDGEVVMTIVMISMLWPLMVVLGILGLLYCFLVKLSFPENKKLEDKK